MLNFEGHELILPNPDFQLFSLLYGGSNILGIYGKFSLAKLTLVHIGYVSNTEFDLTRKKG